MSHFVNFKKAHSAIPAFVVVAASITSSLVACSSSGDARTFDQSPSEATDSGSTVVTKTPDAEAPDASADADAARVADAGADVDAAPRTCSDDNFCYSTVPTGEYLRAVWGDGQGVVWVGSTVGDILRWDGNTWNVQATGLGSLTYISGTGPTDIWAVNAAGGVFHGTGASPSAISFAPVATIPTDATLLIKAVWGTSPTNLWAVGGKQSASYPYAAAGTAYHFDGTAWTNDATLSALPNMYTGVSGTPDGGVVVFGSSTYNSTTGTYRGIAKTGVVMRLAPGGSTWLTENIPVNVTGAPPYAAPFFGASVNLDGSLWLFGSSAFGSGRFAWLATTADKGQTYTWTTYSQFSWEPITTAVWGVAANDAWELGPYGHLNHWDGTSYEQAAIMNTGVPLTKTFYAAWGTSSNDFWVVGDELAVHKTTADKP